MSRDPASFESLLERMVPGSARRDRPTTEPPIVQVHTSMASRAHDAQRAVGVHLPTATMRPDSGGREEVRERLGWASLQLAIASLVVYAVYGFTHTPRHLFALLPGGEPPGGGALGETGAVGTGLPVDHLAANVLIGLSLLTFGLARGRRLPTARIHEIGLLFFVLASAAISLFEQWAPRPAEASPIGLPWVCLWIVLYPMVVPTRGPRLVVAAAVAASTAPLAMLLAVVAHGVALPGLAPLAWLLMPAGLAVLLAVYPAPFIHRLESDARKARELGSYQLLEPLDRGGMGEVWTARHRLLARPAAIKLIRRDALGGELETSMAALQRFQREAAITSSLGSPHTVSLFDFGVTEEGSLYAVMELLDGLDLEELVERFGPLPAERTIHLLTQACASLAEAHARELVHRDVKPANLMACRLGLEVDVLKVLDFGLVRPPLPGEQGEERLTAAGITLGTPAYMAPELARGELEYDHRVDLYALGCVGYYLLTGRPVFTAATPMAMLLCHIQDAPAPPSSHGVRVAADLEAVLMSCLAKTPAERPAGAVALRAALEACEQAGGWTPERAHAWWAEHGDDIHPVGPRTSPSRAVTTRYRAPDETVGEDDDAEQG